jgi:hypothetical protein
MKLFSGRNDAIGAKYRAAAIEEIDEIVQCF